jgi:hypothetical protein
VLIAMGIQNSLKVGGVWCGVFLKNKYFGPKKKKKEDPFGFFFPFESKIEFFLKK